LKTCFWLVEKQLLIRILNSLGGGNGFYWG